MWLSLIQILRQHPLDGANVQALGWLYVVAIRHSKTLLDIQHGHWQGSATICHRSQYTARIVLPIQITDASLAIKEQCVSLSH